MGAIASQITSFTIVYSAVCSGTDQRIHQSSASLVFVRGTHRWPVNSPYKWPVKRKRFPFDDVIMNPESIYTQTTKLSLTEITLIFNSLCYSDAICMIWLQAFRSTSVPVMVCRLFQIIDDLILGYPVLRRVVTWWPTPSFSILWMMEGTDGVNSGQTRAGNGRPSERLDIRPSGSAPKVKKKWKNYDCQGYHFQ